MRAWQPRIGVVALAAAVFWPVRAHAQVELVPHLGFYWPVGGWTDDGTGFPRLRRQLSTALIGTSVTVWLSPRFALDATLGATPSQVAVTTASGTTDLNAGVYMASARALVKVLTLTEGPDYDQVHWDLTLAAGAGLVHRAGTAWQNVSGLTAPAAVFGAVVSVGTIRLSIEDYVSWAQYDVGRPSQTHAGMHQDVVGSLGFSFRLGGR